MNQTNVSQIALQRLSKDFGDFTPEVQKAAKYILENPRDVSVSTVRRIAFSAKVKPNTMVRMARDIGFNGYDEFRELFRNAVRDGTAGFPERTKWLQDIRKEGSLGKVYADMIQGTLNNIEDTFANISVESLNAAASLIWKSRNVYTLGVGVNNANAKNFTYLATTGMIHFHAIPKSGSTAVDELAWADKRDTLIAITCKPYRKEVIESLEIAKKQRLKIISITDSLASPIIQPSDHHFIISNDTPQFFPSSVATIALLETLLSFVISHSSKKIVRRVKTFHRRRSEIGIYHETKYDEK